MGAMQWVRDFYSKQNQWLNMYLGEVETLHHERAQLIDELFQARNSQNLPQNLPRVLELGAGGGQTAVALAQLGYALTTVELLPDSVAHTAKLSAEYSLDIQAVMADFYEVNLPASSFDVIAYFDSFGIGTDADQRLLLSRIAAWLKAGGASVAIIEIGATWFWATTAKGQTMDVGDCQRTYDFDPEQSRLLDHWALHSAPDEVFSQSLRCYTPADLRLLAEGTGLRLCGLKAGGRVDYANLTYQPEGVALGDCMTYYSFWELI
jgi:SAM-dependent methyltransferase